MNYSNIIQYDMANGEGIRTSLFISGCNFHCKGCFNTEAQDFNYGQPFTESTYILIQNYLQSPQVSGLSLLGGDPLCQDVAGLQQLIDLCVYTKSLGKNVWLWTGFEWEDIMNTSSIKNENGYKKVLLSICNVVIDGPFVEELKDSSLAWRGSTNQRIIDVEESLKHNCVISLNNTKLLKE